MPDTSSAAGGAGGERPACRALSRTVAVDVDVKFVTHYGTFIVERDGEREDLEGPDVILVHRLLKNTICDGDGPQAYAFLTQACLERMPQSFGLPSHTEAYESFGETTGVCMIWDRWSRRCARPGAHTSARMRPMLRSAASRCIRRFTP